MLGLSRRFLCTCSSVAVTALLLSISSPLARADDRQPPATAHASSSVGELKLNNVPLSDALDFIRDTADLNMHVNWRALETLGVSRDTNVNVRVRSVTVRKALELILSDAAPGGQMTFLVDQGVVEITTQELADKQLVTRVYHVEDLLTTDADRQRPNLSNLGTGLTSNTNSTSGNSSSSNTSGGLFSSNSQSQQQNTTTNTDKQQADELIKLIETTVRPDIWLENGGPASIRYYNGCLIVTAPRSVLQAIGGF